MQAPMDPSQRHWGRVPPCSPSHHHHSHHHHFHHHYHCCLLNNGCFCRCLCVIPSSHCPHHHRLHYHCINRHLHHHHLHRHNHISSFLPHNLEPIAPASLLNEVYFEDSGSKELQLSTSQSSPGEENIWVEEEEEEPIFVLTDEWKEFFEKGEARRLAEKKQAKNKKNKK